MEGVVDFQPCGYEGHMLFRRLLMVVACIYSEQEDSTCSLVWVSLLSLLLLLLLLLPPIEQV